MTAVARELLDVLFASLWQGAGIALAISIVLALSGRRLNAATRYIVLQGAVVSIAIVPLLTTLRSVQSQPSFVRVSAASTARGFVLRARPADAAPRRIDVFLSRRAILLITGAWLAGVLVFCLRIVAGSLQLRRLVRRCHPLSDCDGVRVLASPDIDVPLAIGFAKPAIVVPAVLAARADAEYRCIVTHELAHVRRGDAYSNAFDRGLQALLYFNPAVLLLLRAIAIEREVACDDWAVARSCDRDTYTRSLASFALVTSHAGFANAFTASPFGRATVVRIDRLEDERRNRSTSLSHFVLGGSLLVLAAIALALRAFMPAIAFASQEPISAATVASTSCPSSQARYVSGPAPETSGAMPKGLKTLVRVAVSPSGKAASASIYRSSGNKTFDRAVVDAAAKGVYAPQKQHCRPLAGTYIFEAITG